METKVERVWDERFGECSKLSYGFLTATVAPAMGMSLVDFRIAGISVLDMSRSPNFFDNRKGFGPIIFPHFNKTAPCPEVNEADFPHVAGLKRLGIQSPFQHGVGRYVAWDWSETVDGVVGRLDSEKVVSGQTLTHLAYLQFKATLTYRLNEQGLVIQFDGEGDGPIQAGIHFYYDLVERQNAVVSLPVNGGKTELDFKKSWDDAFSVTPATDGWASALLTTPTHLLETRFQSGCGDQGFDSLILFSPSEMNCCCIEPITWLAPATPRKTVHAQIQLRPMLNE